MEDFRVCGRKDSRHVEKSTPERQSRRKDEQGARRVCMRCYQRRWSLNRAVLGVR